MNNSTLLNVFSTEENPSVMKLHYDIRDCMRAEIWSKHNNIPMVIPNRAFHIIQKNYKEYSTLPLELKRRSDLKCMEYFNHTNEELYKRFVLHANKNIDECVDIVNSDTIQETGALTSIKVLMESAREREYGIIDRYRLKESAKGLLPSKPVISEIMMDNSPILTPVEIEESKGLYSDKDSLGDFPLRVWMEQYKNSFYGVPCDIDHKIGLDRLRLLQKFGYMQSNGMLKPEDKQSMVNLGWNPEIDYCTEGYGRIYNKIDTFYKDVDMVNVSEFINNIIDTGIEEDSSIVGLQPVFIVFKRTKDSIINNIISKATNSYWAHSAIGFDVTLRNLYTFDGRHGGFTKESIYSYPAGSIINVICCLVPMSTINKMKKTLSSYRKNAKETSYGFRNLISCLTKRATDNTLSMVCSNFVDYMMKIGDIDATRGAFSTIHPGRLRRAIARSKKRRYYNLYKGTIEEYKPTKVKLFLSTVLKGGILEHSEVEDFDKEMKDIFKEMIAPYIDMVPIEEADFPLQFSKDGDLLIYKKSIDFEKEYNHSHMLLKQYEEANNIDGIKYELAKLWYMNTLLEDKIKNSKGSEKQEYTKTRTRILNDFNKYLKIVLKEDKKFNFNRYYKNTPYGDDRVRIRNSTLKYGLKNIRRVITG